MNNNLPAAEDGTAIIGSVKVRPGKGAKLPIGTFRNGEPEPALQVTYDPDIAELMGASAVRVEVNDGYKLSYHFQELRRPNLHSNRKHLRPKLWQSSSGQVGPSRDNACPVSSAAGG